MFHNLDTVVDKMIGHMAQKAGEAKDGVVDVKPIFQVRTRLVIECFALYKFVYLSSVFQSLSLDSISNCAFGIETDSFNNPANKLFTTCVEIFSSFFVLKSAFDSFFFVLSTHFPFLEKLVDVYGAEKWDYLYDTTKEIAETRKKIGKRGDFVDRLNEIKDGGVLNEAQTYAQGIGFFQAGFETTSNTMSTLTYALAKNPQVQVSGNKC